MLHRRVMGRGEHEAYAGLRDAGGNLRRGEVDLYPERHQHVGGAGFGRQRAVAVLGDGHARAGDNEGRAGRDVVGARGIAAGADHIDRVGRRFHAQHLGAHGRDRAGDLLDILAAHPKAHKHGADLRGRRLAGHHDVKGEGGFRAGQRGAGRELADDGLQIFHVLRDPASGCARTAGTRVPRPRQIEEVLQNGLAVLGGDAFRVELHAVHRQIAVRQAHDQPVLAGRRHV